MLSVHTSTGTGSVARADCKSKERNTAVFMVVIGVTSIRNLFIIAPPSSYKS